MREFLRPADLAQRIAISPEDVEPVLVRLRNLTAMGAVFTERMPGHGRCYSIEEAFLALIGILLMDSGATRRELRTILKVLRAAHCPPSQRQELENRLGTKLGFAVGGDDAQSKAAGPRDDQWWRQYEGGKTLREILEQRIGKDQKRDSLYLVVPRSFGFYDLGGNWGKPTFTNSEPELLYHLAGAHLPGSKVVLDLYYWQDRLLADEPPEPRG